MKKYLILFIIALIMLLVFIWWPSTQKDRVHINHTTMDVPLSTSVFSKPKKPTKLTAYQLWRAAENKDDFPLKRFYKVNLGGELIPDDAAYWACVYDSHTGLLWEVKDNNGGLQDQEHTYSWYEPSDIMEQDSSLLQEDDGGIFLLEIGVSNKGACYNIDCDTYSYRQALNLQNLCSSSHWRLPEAYELAQLDHKTFYYPDIDTHYFPNTVSGYYWAHTEPPQSLTLAWSVDFTNGIPYITEKRIPYYVRLVTEATWLIGQSDNRLQNTEDIAAKLLGKTYSSSITLSQKDK